MPAVIIAHRTCPKHAAENSLEGIRRAAALDGIVTDWLEEARAALKSSHRVAQSEQVG